MSDAPKCRNCQHEVSRDAKACPECGEPNPANTLANWGENLQSIGCVLTILITIPIILMFICTGAL